MNGLSWPNSYFFDGLKISMDFRPTFAQTSGENIFGKNFIGSKEPPNFIGTLGGHFYSHLHFMA